MWTERGTARKRWLGYFLKLKQETWFSLIWWSRVGAGGHGPEHNCLCSAGWVKGNRAQIFQELHNDPFCQLVKQDCCWIVKYSNVCAWTVQFVLPNLDSLNLGLKTVFSVYVASVNDPRLASILIWNHYLDIMQFLFRCLLETKIFVVQKS